MPKNQRRPRATTDQNGEAHLAPRDTVRRVPLTPTMHALIGFDADAKARLTVLVEADEPTGLARDVLRLVRKHYPRQPLTMDRTED